MTPSYDVAVVGGGCAGLSIAAHVAGQGLDICVLEKEDRLAAHQSGHNSGVLFPGFVYEPGSQRADLYREGTARAKEFCREHDVPVNECGQLMVARSSAEADRLESLDERAAENGVETTFLPTGERVEEYQPETGGQAGLWCPSVATVDSHQYVHALAREARERGVDVHMGCEVTGVEPGDDYHLVRSKKGDVSTEYVVNAAGLYADRIAHEMGAGQEFQVVPFRGEYYELVVEERDLVERVVYPTPDPDLPYLGAHFMPLPDGRVIVGPSAALAFGREAYSNTDVDLRELAETLGYGGFWRLLASPQMLRAAWDELNKSYRKERFVEDACSLFPRFDDEAFVKSYAGVRAELVTEDGEMVEGLTVRWSRRAMHVLDPVSLTTSLPVGELLADRLLERARQ